MQTAESSTNPYQTPEGELSSTPGAYGEVRLFTAKGRMGRLRFSAYYMLISIISMMLSGMITAAAASLDSQALMLASSVIIGLGSFVVIVMLLIQRLHDLNRSGWWGLLGLVPVLNLFFILYVMLWAGSKEVNDFGNPPPPNGVWAWVGGVILPIVFIGILAAIALPAYQDYVQRAQMMQH